MHMPNSDSACSKRGEKPLKINSKLPPEKWRFTVQFYNIIPLYQQQLVKQVLLSSNMYKNTLLQNIPEYQQHPFGCWLHANNHNKAIINICRIDNGSHLRIESVPSNNASFIRGKSSSTSCMLSDVHGSSAITSI